MAQARDSKGRFVGGGGGGGGGQKVVTTFVTSGSSSTAGALQKISSAAIVLGTNFKDLAGEMQEFLRLGPSVKGLKDAFAALGGTSEQLDKLKAATQGSVSDATLMRLSNVARLADINADALDQFAVRALGASDALGISVEEGFERMVSGVAKMEKELLDELGIKIRSLDTVYAEFAANAGKSVKQLTEEEKKLAFQNEVLASSTKIAEIGANAQANAVEQLGAQWENMKTELAGAVGEFLVSNKVFEHASELMSALGSWFEENSDTMRRLGRSAIDLATAVGSHLAYAFEVLGPIIADAFEGVGEFLGQYSDQISDLIKGGVDLLGKVFTKISAWASENKESLGKVFEFAVKAVEALMAALELLMPVFELVMDGIGLIADGIAWVNDEAEKLQKQVWKNSGAADAKAEFDQRMADKQWLLAQMTNASTTAIEKQQQAVKDSANMTEWEKLGINSWGASQLWGSEMPDYAQDYGRQLEEVETKKAKIRKKVKEKAKKTVDIAPAFEDFGSGVNFFANEAQQEIERQESLQAALLDGRIQFLQAKRDAEEWWLTVKENSAKREMEISEQVAEAERRRNQAIVDGSLSALGIGQDIANAFVKDEKDKAKIAMAMEFARAVGSFALGNYIAGGLHLLSAAKYGIVAGKSAGSTKQAAKKAKAQNTPRGDMNFGWNSMNKRKQGGAVTQTIIQQFPFGSPGPAGRAIADALNGASRGSTGVALDSRMVRKTGRPGL